MLSTLPPPPPDLVDHVLVATFAVVIPVWSAFADTTEARESYRTDPDERRWAYQKTMLWQWGLTAVVLGYWAWSGRAFATIGLGDSFDWRAAAGLAFAAVAIFALFAHQHIALRSPASPASTRTMLERMAPFLPRAKRELPLFMMLAVTAGVCEEIIYRGYLYWYLSTWFGDSWLGWVAVVLAATCIFALGHLYQGAQGVAQVFGVGIAMGALYLLSGSLIPCIVLHAMMDINGGMLAVRVFEATDDRTHPVVDDDDVDDDEKERHD